MGLGSAKEHQDSHQRVISSAKLSWAFAWRVGRLDNPDHPVVLQDPSPKERMIWERETLTGHSQVSAALTSCDFQGINRQPGSRPQGSQGQKNQRQLLLDQAKTHLNPAMETNQMLLGCSQAGDGDVPLQVGLGGTCSQPGGTPETSGLIG